jgi:hypothetical protein
MSNKENRKINRAMAHGWLGSTFFTNGVAKSGESKTYTRTLHKAICLPIETILSEAGLIEGTSRIPFDQREPAIKIVEQIGHPIVSHNGIVVGMEWDNVRDQ